MDGDCDTAGEFEDGLLAMLGIEDLYPQAKPDPVKQAEDAYERAMSIL